MAEIVEGLHTAEFLVSEANGSRSREKITVLSGQNLKVGHVLGRVTVGTVTGAADAGNTGNGTIASVSAGAGARDGVYKAVVIEPAANLGTFHVEDPAGVVIGTGVVGTAFNNEVNFTINDGTANFVAGDFFTITVALGTEKEKELNPSASDGSDVPSGILYDAVDASAADVEGVKVARDAEVNGAEITWPSGITAQEKTDAIASLRDNLGIIIR